MWLRIFLGEKCREMDIRNQIIITVNAIVAINSQAIAATTIKKRNRKRLYRIINLEYLCCKLIYDK